jgi:hypothetical protein
VSREPRKLCSIWVGHIPMIEEAYSHAVNDRPFSLSESIRTNIVEWANLFGAIKAGVTPDDPPPTSDAEFIHGGPLQLWETRPVLGVQNKVYCVELAARGSFTVEVGGSPSVEAWFDASRRSSGSGYNMPLIGNKGEVVYWRFIGGYGGQTNMRPQLLGVPPGL